MTEEQEKQSKEQVDKVKELVNNCRRKLNRDEMWLMENVYTIIYTAMKIKETMPLANSTKFIKETIDFHEDKKAWSETNYD